MIPYGYAPLPWWGRLVLRVAFVAADALYHVRMTGECLRAGLAPLVSIGVAAARWLGRFPW